MLVFDVLSFISRVLLHVRSLILDVVATSDQILLLPAEATLRCGSIVFSKTS